MTVSAPRAGSLPWAGEGVTLRRLSVADLAAFQAYRHDPVLARYQGWSATTDEAARAFLAEMAAIDIPALGEWCQIGIAAPGADELLGDIGLHLDADGRTAEVGITLSRAAQGRGLATAALRGAIDLVFARGAVERVVGITDARNGASARLLERVGMTKTAEIEAVFCGEPCIEWHYALTRTDRQQRAAAV